MGGVVKSIKKGVKKIRDTVSDGINTNVDFLTDPIGTSKDVINKALDGTGINTALKGLAPESPELQAVSAPETTKRAIPSGEQGRPVPPAFGGAVVTSPLGLVDTEDQNSKRKRLLGS